MRLTPPGLARKFFPEEFLASLPLKSKSFLAGRCIQLLERNGFAVNKPLDQVESKLPANRKFTGM
jgi:hypothetical protein